MKIPIRNLYYLLAYAWGHADPARDREADSAPLDTLPDLLAFVLAERVAQLLRRGLDRNYVEESVVVAGVRGKLEFGATIKRNLLSQARTQCTVEEFRYDVLQNRIIRATLRKLLSLPHLNSTVRSEVGLVYRKLEGITDVPLRKSSFRRVRIHRNNQAYGFLMHLCRLIHESLRLEEDGTATFVDVRRRRGEMARVFEDFVANFYRAEQSRFRVGAQRRLGWHDAKVRSESDMERLPGMIPDVTLDSPDRRIVLDTKYYRRALAEGRFGGKRVRPGHLYQIFAYVENRNAAKPDGPPHEGMLLYPAVGESFHYDFRLKGHRIQVRTIDLDQDWTRIHHDLVAAIEASV